VPERLLQGLGLQMRVFVKTLTGNVWEIEVDASPCWIWSIKIGVFNRQAIVPSRQRLIFDNTEAVEELFGWDYYITNEATLHLVTCPLNSFPIPLLPPPSLSSFVSEEELAALKTLRGSDEDETVVMMHAGYAYERWEWMDKALTAITERQERLSLMSSSMAGMVVALKVPPQPHLERSGGVVLVALEVSPHPSMQRIRLLTPVHHPLLYCPTGDTIPPPPRGRWTAPSPWGSVLWEPEGTEFAGKDAGGKLDMLYDWVTRGPSTWPKLDPAQYIAPLQPWLSKWNHPGNSYAIPHKSFMDSLN